jgi:CRP-like cAMP-binding protein
VSHVSDDDLQRNRLLAVVGDESRRRIGELGEIVTLNVRDVVFEQGRRIEHVHFPLNGVLSMVSKSNGHAVEIATVGREGMLGLPVFLQASFTSSHMAFCQIASEAVRVPADAFGDALARDGELHTVLHRYTQALFTQLAQSAACNAIHDIRQRAARWLLTTHDRVDGDEFELTQEFLAQMLAVGRPAVNTVAQAFQDRGLMSYVRGRVAILDRDGLHREACVCYDVIRSEHERLIGASG